MPQSITHFHVSHPIQQPFDAAVVIPTTGRASLTRAATSVFRQAGVRRLQVLIGIDVMRGNYGVIEEVLAARTAPHAVTVLDLGYSTSTRHSGVYLAADGGALRTILTYMANSRYVTYLDDDNWYDETHIARLLAAIKDRDWAYTLRWFVDPDILKPLAIDRWESVGPDQGVYGKAYGGFVDPNCLMIDKLKCDDVVRFWTIPLFNELRRLTADRNVFAQLRRHPRVGFTDAATTYYVMNAADANNITRLKWIRDLYRRRGETALTDRTPLPVWEYQETVRPQEA